MAKCMEELAIPYDVTKMLGERFYSHFTLYTICVTALVQRQAFPFPKVN